MIDSLHFNHKSQESDMKITYRLLMVSCVLAISTGHTLTAVKQTFDLKKFTGLMDQATSIKDLDSVTMQAEDLNPTPSNMQKLFDIKNGILKKYSAESLIDSVDAYKKIDADQLRKDLYNAPLSVGIVAQDALNKAVLKVYETAISSATTLKKLNAIPSVWKYSKFVSFNEVIKPVNSLLDKQSHLLKKGTTGTKKRHSPNKK